MMRRTMITVPFLTCCLAARAQGPAEPGADFGSARESLQEQLEESLAELSRLRDRLADEKIPLAARLGELEAELIAVRAEYQQTSRRLDARTLELTTLQGTIGRREDEATYLTTLLGEYIRDFEARLQIAEVHRYEAPLEAALLAVDNDTLSALEVYRAQTEMLFVAFTRLEDALGGTRFEGAAVDGDGLVNGGTFALVGPAALFRSSDGAHVGTVEQRLGSLEPSVIAFGSPADGEAASQLVVAGAGRLPLDPTLGNAHRIESTQETLVEHIRKGGPVMVPIFVLAAAALLVALYKWTRLMFLRKPPASRVKTLLATIARRDEKAAHEAASLIPGPVGRMLRAGVAHLREPRELIEEAMYETVLTTRLQLNRMLPFIAIAAASAPLLGLLGTVTGIINTFKLITVFGSGDVKTLSGGISEALITTEFGLIVAIPSLLLHAFLSRKARGIIDGMEVTAVSFVNQVSRTPLRSGATVSVAETLGDAEPQSAAPTAVQVREALMDMLVGSAAGAGASED